MRLTILSFSTLLFFSCSQDPICLTEEVNPIIGNAGKDAYFAASDNVSEEALVQSHLRYAEEMLRSIDVDHLTPSQKEKRSHALDLLEEYWQAGIFPGNFDYPNEKRPCFIDREGRICAVGYLVEQTAGRSAAEKINADYQYAFIEEMPDELLDAWMNEFGFDKKEIAIIQPAYNFIEFKKNDIGFTYSLDFPLLVGSDNLGDETSITRQTSCSFGLAYTRSIRRINIRVSLLNSRKAFSVNHDLIDPHSEPLASSQNVELNYLEVPLVVNYNRHLWRKFSFHIDAGVVPSFLTNSNETTHSADGSAGDTELITEGVSDFLLSAQLVAGINVGLTNRLACSILPYYRYTPSSLQPDYLAQGFSTIGLGGMLNYHF